MDSYRHVLVDLGDCGSGMPELDWAALVTQARTARLAGKVR
jgi:hypothetical protein